MFFSPVTHNVFVMDTELPLFEIAVSIALIIMYRVTKMTINAIAWCIAEVLIYCVVQQEDDRDFEKNTPVLH